MPTIKVDARNLGNVLRAHMRARQRDLIIAARETCHRGAAEAVRIADAEGLVDMGEYKRGFVVRDTPSGPVLVNDTPYAGVIELGRRKRRPGPPLAPIKEWCRRKLGLTGAELDSAAFLIRRSIHRKGSRPRMVMFRVQRQMRPWFRAAVERRLRIPTR